MPSVFKLFVEKQGGRSANTYIGKSGEIFYDPTTTTLRVGDGQTPGGTVVSGGGGAGTGNFTFSDDTITNQNGLTLQTDRGTLAIGTSMEGISVAGHFHIAFDNSNINTPASDLFLGDDYNYVKLPGYELNPTAQFGVEIGAHNRDGGSNHVWRFGTDGALTFPGGQLIGGNDPNDEFFKLQAKDTNSLLRNEINLDPNNGTYMSVWSGELDASFSAVDWDTASWQNNGGQGYAIITNAEDLHDFWTTGPGSIVNSVEVSINGGARTPVLYYGDNEEQYDVELLITAIPGSTTEITSLTFYYQTQSKIEIDYDGGEILLDGQALNINLQTTNGLTLQSGQILDIKNIGQSPVRIFTDNTTHTWEFDSGGSLTLPREGRITGIGDGPAGDRYGYISWAGNSSGDGAGYNTMRLVPDSLGLEDADQYIILDPTSPGHIHIRAGGTQDNSQAILFFGGENSYVKVDSGPNPPVSIASSSNVWTFGTNGNLTLPANGSIVNSSGNTVFVSLAVLKSLVADSATYADFQTAISNL